MCKFASREFALMALACCAAQFSVAENAPVASPETEHIRHVTSGLTSDVVIKGDEHATHMLVDRMKELNIRGVSIAVIHEGKIEWARGFAVGGSPGDTRDNVSGRLHQQAPGSHGGAPAGRAGQALAGCGR
jgi:CubicO group peptidase (beta-lactamase class C family)